MYSLLIIFSPLLNTLPAAWLQCAMTPHVWRCYCPSSTSRNVWNPELDDSVFLLAGENPMLHFLYIWFAVNFALCSGTCASLHWHFVGFFLNMLQNRVAVLQDGYFNLLFSIFNKILSIVTWVCHAGHIKMSTLSHVYLRVTSNVNPNLEWLCLNRMNHLLLFLFQSRVISFSA